MRQLCECGVYVGLSVRVCQQRQSFAVHHRSLFNQCVVCFVYYSLTTPVGVLLRVPLPSYTLHWNSFIPPLVPTLEEVE